MKYATILPFLLLGCSLSTAPYGNEGPDVPDYRKADGSDSVVRLGDSRVADTEDATAPEQDADMGMAGAGGGDPEPDAETPTEPSDAGAMLDSGTDASESDATPEPLQDAGGDAATDAGPALGAICDPCDSSGGITREPCAAGGICWNGYCVPEAPTVGSSNCPVCETAAGGLHNVFQSTLNGQTVYGCLAPPAVLDNVCAEWANSCAD